MAELVQQRMEEMLLEIEQLERLGILNAKETRAILRRRRSYQYKIQRKTKEKTDFLNFIQYESDVLALIAQRRKETRCKNKGRGQIDQPIIRRIQRLFTAACKRFPEDLRLWFSHIDFCKKVNSNESVGYIYTKMLQLHSSKPDVWVLAAKWEMDEMKNMSNARKHLQRGLRFNPNSQHLWRECFRMELLNADKLRKRRQLFKTADMDMDEEDGASDVIMNGQVAQLVYEKAVEHIPDDVQFKLSFVEITQLFDFMQPFEQRILTNIEEEHGDLDITWDILAHRKWDDAHTFWKEKSIDKKIRVARVADIEEECMSIYQTAVDNIPQVGMWTLYLKFLLELVEEKVAAKKRRSQRIEAAHTAFRAAKDVKKLSEECAILWIKLITLTQSSDDLLALTAELVETDFQKSVAIWGERLHCLATCEMEEGQRKVRVQSQIQKALNAAPHKDSLPLWKFAIEWSALNDTQKAVQSLFEAAVLRPEIAAEMKTLYLDWAAVHLTAKASRKIFKQLSVSQPLTVELFRTYIRFEQSQMNPSLKKIHAAFDSALSYFGSTDTDLWMDFLKIAAEHPLDFPEKVGQIYFRAKTQLDAAHVERFFTQYSLFQTGHSIS